MNDSIIGRKIQTVTISKDASGNSTDPVSLDTSYDRCVGIIPVEIDDSGVTDYNIGLSSGGQTVLDPVNAKAIQVDRSVGQGDRVLPLAFSTKSTVDVITQVNSAPTDTLKFQLLFILERDENC